MPVVNQLARELVFKVVYYGPGLGGKTTSLQHIHATSRPEHRGKMLSLATPVDRTLYFDFLPIRVPGVRGMNVRLQLFTVPGQVYYNATRKLVLTGADGIVLVFDSQRGRGDANLESLENLSENLRAHGRELSSVPHVIEYNKRDLFDVSPVDELERQLNLHGAPSFACVATSGEGIYESLEAITRGVLEDFERRMPEARGIASAELRLPEGGLADALRRAGPAEPVALREAAPEAPVSIPDPSSLSLLPETDLGEAAALAAVGAPSDVAEPAAKPAAATAPPASEEPPSWNAVPLPLAAPDAQTPASPGVGFELLWPPAEQLAVRELEVALCSSDHARAVALSEQLIARSLAGAAAALGTSDAPRDPLTIALSLGIEGRRYIEFRSLSREARGGRRVSHVEALAAYALAIQVRLARGSLGA
jgi:signal recognition particle receptor subunit beta